MCDFVYDEIRMCNEAIAIIKSGWTQKFYYINSRLESEFSASAIYPLKDNFFKYHGTESTKGVIDCYGNIILPDRYVYLVEGNNAITYESYEGTSPDAPPTTYYNRNFEVVCYNSLRGTADKDGNIIWNNFILNTPITASGKFKNIYVIQKNTPNNALRALAAINEIPKPPCATENQYISIMFNNPLVNINGNTRTIEQKNYFYTPVVRNDRILLPYELLEVLNIWTTWDEQSQTISAGRGENILTLKLDSNTSYFNGAAISLDVPAQIIQDKVLVPYEFVAVTLGADWNWDGENETLTLFFD